MHREKCRHALQGCPVADARRNGDDRSGAEARHETGQGTFHSGNDDYRIGINDVLDRREQAMDARNATIAEQAGVEAERAKNGNALLGDGKVGSPGCADEQARGPIGLLAPDDRVEATRLRHRGRPAPARRHLD